MPTRTEKANNEVAIWSRVLEADKPTLSAAAARAFLALDFSPTDRERMRSLLGKAKAGTLTADEQDEINTYERVGHILNLLQAKVRRSFRNHRGTPANGPTPPH